MTDARVHGVQADVAYLQTGVTLRVPGLQVDVAYVYSGPPVVAGPTLSVWNGTAEVAATASVWTGSAEVAATIEIAP